jgi:hypothetical protein
MMQVKMSQTFQSSLNTIIRSIMEGSDCENYEDTKAMLMRIVKKHYLFLSMRDY